MNLKEASILFVEDEPFLRESMGAWLGQQAGRALCAENGEEALKILAANKIELVISDVRMPVMDGIALVKKIHEAPPPWPAVILISGFCDFTTREAYEIGVDAIVEKPINREELVRAMHRNLAPEEIWQATATASPGMKLEVSFPSLAAALQEQRLAFGRRGFCIKPPTPLGEGPVAFTLKFKADRRVLSGEGVVRWTDPLEGQAGIEITRLDSDGREWLLDLVRRSAPVASIPSGMRRTTTIKAA